jgi:hypothetical protein
MYSTQQKRKQRKKENRFPQKKKISLQQRPPIHLTQHNPNPSIPSFTLTLSVIPTEAPIHPPIHYLGMYIPFHRIPSYPQSHSTQLHAAPPTRRNPYIHKHSWCIASHPLRAGGVRLSLRFPFPTFALGFARFLIGFFA